MRIACLRLPRTLGCVFSADPALRIAAFFHAGWRISVASDQSLVTAIGSNTVRRDPCLACAISLRSIKRATMSVCTKTRGTMPCTGAASMRFLMEAFTLAAL